VRGRQELADYLTRDSASFMGQSVIVPSSCCSICDSVVVSKVSHQIGLLQRTA